MVAGVSGLGGEGGAEGIKTRLDTLPPVWKVGDTVRFLIVFSNWDTVLSRLASVELKGVEGSAIGVVGDSVEMLELIIHCLIFNPKQSIASNFTLLFLIH